MIADTAPKDICIVRLSAIGDTCHALAVARNLQDNWPDARITWIIGKTEASLLADIPDIEFIIFDKSKGSAAYRDIKRTLSEKRFDIALCMHASLRANRLCRSIPAPIRLGFDRRRARDFQWLFTNRRIPARKEEHALEAMMGFARHIGAKPTPLRWDIPLSDADREFGERHCDRPTVVISPCSSQRSRNFRNWSVENYVAIVEAVQRNHGAQVLLTGSNTRLEHGYGMEIAKGCSDPPINLIGRSNLKQLLAVIAAADVLVCPDSGPAHMATAVGTPVVGLYATSNPARTGPYLSKSFVVNRYPDAVERYLGKSVAELRWGKRVRHPDAMSLIDSSDVLCKIDDILGN